MLKMKSIKRSMRKNRKVPVFGSETVTTLNWLVSFFLITTAALLWASATYGITMGTSMFEFAFGIYVTIWIIIIVDRFLESKGIGIHQRTLTIVITDLHILKEFKNNLSGYKMNIERTSFDKKSQECTIYFNLQLKTNEIENLITKISSFDTISKIDIV